MRRQNPAMTPENLRALRLEFGLTQTQLAWLVYLSGFTRISDWERKRHPIDPARWELMLIKLGKHTKFKPVDYDEIADMIARLKESKSMPDLR